MENEAREMQVAVDRIIDAIRDVRLTAAALEIHELAGFFERSEAQYIELQVLVRAAVADYEARITLPS